MKASRLVILAVAGLMLCHAHRASADESQIPVVGVDPSGHSKLVMVPRSRFSALLGQAVKTVNDSVLDALSAQAPQKCVERNPWDLSMILVGLGIDLDLGAGPLGSVSASAEFNLVFSNKKGPAVP